MPTAVTTTRRRLALGVAAFLALAALFPGGALAGGSFTSGFFEPSFPSIGTINGSVPLGGMNVALMAASPGGKAPVRLGSARSRGGGALTIHYEGNEARSIKYLVATRPGGSYRLALALGEGELGADPKVTERTTVAMGFAMAQFIGPGDKVGGKNPGLRNAAAMSHDLVDPTGGLGKVLRTFPNGGSTSTLPAFNSLADLVALCHHRGEGCASFLSKARAPGSGPARDTLAAVANIARYPWHDVSGLFGLAIGAGEVGPWQPSLDERERPDAWTLALRFEGHPPGMDGPGNFAIDGGGNLWVANNYGYDRDPKVPACGSDKLFRFTPTGQTYPGSPYVGGGLSGVGFGVTIDPRNRVWLGNFGFEGKGCTTVANHYPASAFALNGKTLSPKGGWEVGGINWPQGTISDQQGRIWLANCGNDSVTRIDPPDDLYAGSPPPPTINFGAASITAGSGVAFERPFADAVNAKGEIFVTANASDSVARLSPSGKPLSLVTGGGLHLPMGIAGDSNGYMWVSNSKWVVAPCPGVRTKKEVSETKGAGGGDVTLLKPNGKVAPGSPIEGAGLNNPWGIAVDADDQVWAANFGGQRPTQLCGTT